MCCLISAFLENQQAEMETEIRMLKSKLLNQQNNSGKH